MGFRCYFFIGLLFWSAGCAKKTEKVAVEVFAHGGTGFFSETNPLPQNSLPALKKGLHNAVLDVIEVDVRCAKDTSFWLFHDASTTFFLGEEGSIEQRTRQELERLNFQYPSADFSPLVSLDDLIHLHRENPSQQIRLHLKFTKEQCWSAFLDRTFPSAISFSTDQWAAYPVLYGSYPTRAWFTHSDIPTVLNYFGENGVYGMELNFHEVDQDGINVLKSKGIRTSLYGMRRYPDYKTARSWGVQEWQVDNSTLAFQVLTQ